MKKKIRITIDVVMEEKAVSFLEDRLARLLQDSGLSKFISTDFVATMTCTDNSELFPAEEDYFNIGFSELEDDPNDTFSSILVLEVADLLSNDVDLNTIKVGKDIFDDFKKGTTVEIEFTDDNPGVVQTYQMVSEDDEGITMVYLGTA